MKYYLFLYLLFYSFFVYCFSKDDSSKVVILKGDKYFYLSPNGEQIPTDSSIYDINDFYTKYYQRIYNDSTLVNPNYILPNKKNKSIIFFMDISEFIKNNRFGFDFNDFIKLDNKTYKLKDKAIKKLKKE